MNKSKDKKKIHIHNYDHSQQPKTPDNLDLLEYVPNHTSSNRRKIYFKAPTKSILSNSIDLKTINIVNNPEIKT